MTQASQTKKRIGVLGASGYTGAELVRLLLRHPRVEIVLLTADRRAGQYDARCLPAIRALCAAGAHADRRHRLDQGGLDLVFCALPHGTTQKVIKDLLAQRPPPRWSTSPPISALAIRPPMRAGTATSIMRRSCRKRRSTASPKSTGAQIKRGAARRQSRLLHDLRAAAAHSAAEAESDRSRRDRDRCEVRHDRRGQGGQGGNAVFRGLGRLPCLWRRPPSPHGRARPGILQGRRARGGRRPSRRISCR